MQPKTLLRLAAGLAVAIASPMAAQAQAKSPASPLPVRANPVPVPGNATPIPAHQRVLPLEGGQNFRDLGGYKTADGREVKWGAIFRSGAMNRLTDADFRYLATLGLQSVVDFRDNRERAKEPVQWPAGSAPQLFAKDYSMDQSGLGRLLSKPGLTGDQAKAAMAELYREIPLTFADQYRVLFARLLGDEGAVAFNCSAGKDRTGVAAAILLSVFGVPRETVIEDYLLSNQYFRPRADMMNTTGPEAEMLRTLPPDVLKVLMGVDRSYLEAAFASIDSQPGGMDGYLRNSLGLDPARIALLKAKYLTAPARG